jgi:hypothetical protein
VKLCLAVALPVVVACASGQPDALTAAEVACRVEVQTVLDTGACDSHASLGDCPAFRATMALCKAWLDAAEAQANE